MASINSRSIAGVRVPLLENIDFEIRPYSMFNAPKWYADGIHLLEELAHTAIEREFMLAKLNLLEHARKKTTQKVNLFEKVQIPGYQDALRKIKRFMEDEENLSKSSQKIMKSHQEKRKDVSRILHFRATVRAHLQSFSRQAELVRTCKEKDHSKGEPF